MQKKIQSALISVFYKDGLEQLVKELSRLGVTIYSTGGTQKFIEDLGISCVPVESLTTYPSILGGRVKTLHPAVVGGIRGRRDVEQDLKEMQEYKIPEIDLVIVDLYPFEKTLEEQQQKASSTGGGLEEASDGEEASMPVLTNKMLVTESLPLSMRSSGTKNGISESKKIAIAKTQIATPASPIA